MMTEKIEKIASDLSDLESPVLRACNLAMALRMMASGDEIRGEAGDAVATVAGSLVEILEEIEETRQRIYRAAKRSTIAGSSSVAFRNVKHLVQSLPPRTAATRCASSMPFSPEMGEQREAPAPIDPEAQRLTA